MTTRYVGPGGNDGNNGLTWATRKLTLTGVEDTPVAAGDTVYVGPGTYRETLTVDVSGTAGNVIAYIGDYTGANTDGVGGVVRITGSDDDITETRGAAVSMSAKNYRSFSGFTIDLTSRAFSVAASCTDLTLTGIYSDGGRLIEATGTTQARIVVTRCYVTLRVTALTSNYAMLFNPGGAGTANGQHEVSNCVFVGDGLISAFVFGWACGGVTVKNCLFYHCYTPLRTLSLPAGYTPMTVNNCIITGAQFGFQAGVLGEIVEDYNAISGTTTARVNTATGANSNTYPLLADSRWFHEAINGGRLLTPLDLAPYCAIVNVAGTSPIATDLRGTGTLGAQREWGALEYDGTLLIEGGSGGQVRILPALGGIG